MTLKFLQSIILTPTFLDHSLKNLANNFRRNMYKLQHYADSAPEGKNFSSSTVNKLVDTQ
jgi:hypothetical protein